MSAPLTLIRLDVDGFKRIKAARIQPKGGVPVELRGRMAQGKSSVLDAIEAALVGRDAIPARPVHEAGKRATIKCDFGNLVVTREIRPDGKHTLKIQSADPNQPQSQAWLDEQIGQLSFDPYAFTRLTPKEQAAKLRQAIGIDTTDLDAARKEAYDERTLVNRELSRVEAAMLKAEFPDGPDEPVDVAGLLREIEAANTEARKNDETRAEATAAEREYQAAASRVQELSRLLAEAERVADAKLERFGALSARACTLVDPETSTLQDKVREADAVNAVVRLRGARRQLADELANKAAESGRLSHTIATIDETKKAMLEAASFPVPNVRLDEDGVYLNGEPIEQASQGESIVFAVAVGLALNPNIRILLIRDASLLDEDAREQIGAMVAERGGQVWFEITSKAGAGWLIEDGEVVAVDGQPVEQGVS